MGRNFHISTRAPVELVLFAFLTLLVEHHRDFLVLRFNCLAFAETSSQGECHGFTSRNQEVPMIRAEAFCRSEA
jgi:hypothetical protein